MTLERRNIGWGGVALLVMFAVFIFFMNAEFVFCSDDCAYGLNIRSLKDVWVLNWNDGYRPVVHFFVRLFTGLLPKAFFNVFNTLLGVSLVLLVIRLAKGCFDLSYSTVILTASFVFCILCKGEAYLWCAGSVNYLWTAVATLCFLLFYRQIDDGRCTLGQVCVGLIPILFVGWMQEAFSLPVLFSLLCVNLLNRNQFNLKKLLACLAYLLGASLLCLVASRRCSTIEAFSVRQFCLTLVKIFMAIKAVWVLLVVFSLSKYKKEFVLRNKLELFIVCGSVGMITVVGFNGERSLWAANLAAIVVCVRELRLGWKLCLSLSVAFLLLIAQLVPLAVGIHDNILSFREQYLKSEDGVAVHERVDCGVLARFFYQCVYPWQPNGHSITFAHFYGKAGMPIGLSKKLYEDLYVQDRICVPENRLPIKGEFYTLSSEIAVVMKLSPDDCAGDRFVRVTYQYPPEFASALKREYNLRKHPPVPQPHLACVLTTKHGRYLLVPKEFGADKYIKSVDFGG